MNKVCFGCGEFFEGNGVLCEKCKAKRLERVKAIKPLKPRSIITNLLDYLAVIISIILM